MQTLKILGVFFILLAALLRGGVALSAPVAAAAATGGCQGCHAVVLDRPHQLACAVCHQGHDRAPTREEAHAGLISRPAHPAAMAASCGPCHRQQVEKAAASLHFTLRNEINAVRAVFGATEKLPSLLEIPVHDPPASPLELADDLLRRRCLRCHVYYAGDNYSATRRGTGCAACHLQFADGRLQSHAFRRRPTDDQCLACHYGNFVGADYYGRFEHDFNLEYRTPFAVNNAGRDFLSARPYGVEYHQLVPDVHQANGLSCVDCHPGAELMGTGHGDEAAAKITCAACHLRPADLADIIAKDGEYFLRGKASGRLHRIPGLEHEAHKTYGARVACVVCHAQWGFNDQETHLLRQDVADYEPMQWLTVQGSSEVERASDAELDPLMTDKITGAGRPGLWYKGYGQRRWETLLVDLDVDGQVKVFRPVLDLHLSYVNQAGAVVFDAVGTGDQARGRRPYTPHTIGKAGIFYRQRLLPEDGMDGEKVEGLKVEGRR